MKSVYKHLTERSTPVSNVVLPKVTMQELRDMILKEEDIDTVDYSDVTNMKYMFYNCKELEELPDTFDTSKVTNMWGIFDGCKKLGFLPNPQQFKDYPWNKEEHPLIFKKYPELFKSLTERSAPNSKQEYKQCDELPVLVSHNLPQSINDIHNLIQKGCSPNSMNSARKTVLILMVQKTRGNWDYFDIKEFLETYDIDIDAQDVRGATALHFACIRDEPRVVELLLKHNADKDVLDKQGNPPKHYAGTKTRHLV